jgi:hypothetical protein
VVECLGWRTYGFAGRQNAREFWKTRCMGLAKIRHGRFPVIAARQRLDDIMGLMKKRMADAA